MSTFFLSDISNRIGESPVWDERRNQLFWVDIPEGQLHSLDLGTKAHRHWQFEGPVGCVSLARSDRLVIAIGGSVHYFDIEREELTSLAVIEAEFPKKRLNDGKVGPDGAFWIGSMDDRPVKEPIGALYRVNVDGSVSKMITDFKVSNGLAWSVDKRTMYHSDSRGCWIDRWNFDPLSGAIDGRQRIRILTEAEGRPDGAACDTDGGYWSCGVSAGCLNRFDRDGQLLQRIEVPVPHPTMLCFGGMDMRKAYITSLKEGMSREQRACHPNAGRLVTLDLDRTGVAIERFRD